MSILDPRLSIGANNPPVVDPDVLAREAARVREFADAAGEFLDLGEITNADQAGRLKDCLDGARRVYKQVDTARKDAKQPHMDAAAAVEKAFKSALLTIENTIAKLKPMQTDWLRREEARIAAEKAAAQQRAKEAADAAERLRLEAEARNDVVGITAAAMAAEEAAAQAKAAERDRPARIESATGGGKATGLRHQRYVVIENWTLAFMAVRDVPAVREAIEAALNARVRSKEYGAAPYKIGGVDVRERVSS